MFHFLSLKFGVYLFISVRLCAVDLINQRSEIFLYFLFGKDLLLLNKPAVVVVGKVLDNAFFGRLLDIVYLNFEVVVIANSEASCNVKLFYALGKLVHFLMGHSGRCLSDANGSDEKNIRCYFGKFVKTACIAALFIKDLFVAQRELHLFVWLLDLELLLRSCCLHHWWLLYFILVSIVLVQKRVSKNSTFLGWNSTN